MSRPDARRERVIILGAAGRDFHDFLTRYRQLRAKVVNAGQVVAQAADVTDLLLACGLDTAQHSAILSNLRREKGLKTPESQLQFVLDELKALEEELFFDGAAAETSMRLAMEKVLPRV